ncbi:MAG: hypothetical protein GDA50_08440 [Alphaproteobacteria bacterium GM202ARS2]|nr:hypothetical protein [Alphaproteobacteria bacterium GM202ARS2]
MLFAPKLKESEGALIQLKNGLCYSLTRLINFRSENKTIEVLDNVKIVHESKLSNPWGMALRGDRCWNQEEIKGYSGPGSSVRIEAYRGVKDQFRHTIEYTCDWKNSEYYIECISDSYKGPTPLQQEFDQKNRALIISLVIIASARIATTRPVTLLKFPNSTSYSSGSSAYQVTQYGFRSDAPFELAANGEEALRKLADSIYEKVHPEAYLASLRLFRAINRRRLDDSILDLIIGLEALLNAGKDSGIRSRIARRLSRLLKQRKEDERKTKEIINKSYNYRNDLSHGNKRQIEFLEDLISSTDKKILINELNLQEVKCNLVELACRALRARYLDHLVDRRDELFIKLDSQP